MNKQHRRESGSTLVILVLMTMFLVVPLILVLVQFGGYIVDRQRAQNIVEAAGILAANDVSRMIIDDPTFGYVSLSNYPAIGRATAAPDGEPLPVTGINTLIATLRHNAIIARELRNRTMASLVDIDYLALETTISELNVMMSDSLNGISSRDCADIYGETIDPVEDVTAFLRANLPQNMELESVTLSNGWLVDGGSTTVPVSQPHSMARVQDEDCRDGNYKPFIDLSVDNRSFSFAGLGSSSTIVSSSDFREADNEHMSSIVKIECKVTRNDKPLLPFEIPFFKQLQCAACSQPYSQPDAATRGAMTVRFPGSPVAGLQSWSDFLRSSNFRDNMVTTYDIAGGDYPYDRDARMVQTMPDGVPGTAQQFAEHLYYWLRNGHGRCRMDAVLSMIREPFPASANETYVYEIADNGAIARRMLAGDQFPTGVTADAQYSSTIDTSVQGGISPVIVFRNNVKVLGVGRGGKHGGQPLAGYPLDSRELQQYAGDEQLALRFGRRSLYRRGLALDIEIGGTRESTASIDMERIRARVASRKI